MARTSLGCESVKLLTNKLMLSASNVWKGIKVGSPKFFINATKRTVKSYYEFANDSGLSY
jgi:hypothetical protein